MTAPAPVHSARAHSPWGASGAKLWMNCPGSVRMQRGLPNVTTVFAAEGTAAHEVAERILLGEPPGEIVGTTIHVEGFDIFVTAEMVEHALQYARVIWADQADYGGDLLVEQKFDLSEVLGAGTFGTTDALLIYTADRVLRDYDFKYGAGVPVSATRNYQGLYYALGALQVPGVAASVDEIEIVIVQPRARDHEDENGVSRWRISVVDMLDVADEMAAAIKASKAPDAPCIAGDWCTSGFCRARPQCDVFRSWALGGAGASLAADGSLADVPPSPTGMDADILGRMLAQAIPALKGWIAAMEQHAFREAEAGRPPTGFQLVDKRAVRRYIDEEEALRHAAGLLPIDEVTTPAAIISPAELEKKLGKKVFAAEFGERVKKVSSGKNLAPITSTRPKRAPSATEDFADEPDYADVLS